eukprot:gene16601-22675_t
MAGSGLRPLSLGRVSVPMWLIILSDQLWIVALGTVDSHALLTRLPLPLRGARLACVKPAASVRSEPGSNSQVENSKMAFTSRLELTRTSQPIPTLHTAPQAPYRQSKPQSVKDKPKSKPKRIDVTSYTKT